MLTAHDESLFHQAPLTFSQAATSDHRFYDRIFFMMYDPAKSASAMLGMGVYKNMNVIDAFACVVRNGTQHNVRASRPLRPDFETQVGPIQYRVIEPFRRLHFSVARNASGTALDLTYTSEIEPFLEGRWEGNHRIIDGRTAVDTQRFDGIGRWNGWVEVAGERLEVNNWCGGRDHSWGVRGGVGGYEPVTGQSKTMAGEGNLLGYFQFGDNVSMAGYCLWTEDGSGRHQTLEGAVRWHPRLNKRELRIKSLVDKVHFPADRRQFDAADLTMLMDDGSTWQVEFRQAIQGTILKGYGGHGHGFHDKRGFGVHRGELLEFDTYDLRAADMRGLPVETPTTVRVNGEDHCYGWGTVLATGALPNHGLKAQSAEEVRRYGVMADNVAAE